MIEIYKDIYFNFEEANLLRSVGYPQDLGVNDEYYEYDYLSTINKVYVSDEPENLLNYDNAKMYGCLDQDYQERHKIDVVLVPSIYEVSKWLRQDKQYFVEVRINNDSDSYFYAIWKINPQADTKIVKVCQDDYDKYEEALKVGIIETLNLLKNGK